jgi:hypothetical protein
VLKVLAQDGDWFQVQFEDPQWGRRTGWVQGKHVSVTNESLKPMDLSVRETPVVVPPAIVTPAASVAVERTMSVPVAGRVRSIYIDGFDRMVGPERKVASCLTEKMQAQGPFTFPETSAGADAVLTMQSHIPKGSSRVLWGSAPAVIATLRATSGATIWQGTNKYRKGTTAWGTGTDMECGLANGLANKLVKAIA